MNTSTTQAVLALEDGSLFYGRTSSSNTVVCGEIIFNTSMTGYQEICTDPSYENQIVLFTTSHIGNVGVNKNDNESSHTWVKGIITREMSKRSSNWRSEKSFVHFLHENNVPWIEGLDTRKLTRHIRNYGTKKACIMVGAIDIDLARSLAKNHSSKEKTPSTQSSPKHQQILVYDFGVKTSILRMVTRLGCSVTSAPNTMSATKLLSYNPSGIIISNGPGDPSTLESAIEEVQKLIVSGVPVFGICLGCQLIALAAGGSTKKMKFGHHGANHPVYDLTKKKVSITSQNHNFVIDEPTLPSEFEVTHISLLDGSVQGIRSKNYPVFGFQGHPEGSPGPQDIKEVFTEFLEMVNAHTCQ